MWKTSTTTQPPPLLSKSGNFFQPYFFQKIYERPISWSTKWKWTKCQIPPWPFGISVKDNSSHISIHYRALFLEFIWVLKKRGGTLDDDTMVEGLTWSQDILEASLLTLEGSMSHVLYCRVRQSIFHIQGETQVFRGGKDILAQNMLHLPFY